MSPLTQTTDRVNTEVRQAIATMLRGVVQLSLSAATIAVSATGYARTDGGSFLDDGFVDGAELTAAGFANAANNGLSYITSVTPAALTVARPAGAPALVNEAAGPLATLALAFPKAEDDARGEFTAVPGVPWSRLTLLRAGNASRRLSVGEDPTRAHTGWASVDLFYPRDTGANAPNSMADAIRQAAEKNEMLVASSGRTIYLLELGSNAGPSVLTHSYDDIWYKLPVRIPYYTIT